MQSHQVMTIVFSEIILQEFMAVVDWDMRLAMDSNGSQGVLRSGSTPVFAEESDLQVYGSPPNSKLKSYIDVHFEGTDGHQANVELFWKTKQFLLSGSPYQEASGSYQYGLWSGDTEFKPQRYSLVGVWSQGLYNFSKHLNWST